MWGLMALGGERQDSVAAMTLALDQLPLRDPVQGFSRLLLIFETSTVQGGDHQLRVPAEHLK